MRRNKKAQSTLEYIVVLAAVMAAIITFSTSTFRGVYTNGLNRITNQMGNVLNRFTYK